MPLVLGCDRLSNRDAKTTADQLNKVGLKYKQDYLSLTRNIYISSPDIIILFDKIVPLCALVKGDSNLQRWCVLGEGKITKCLKSYHELNRISRAVEGIDSRISEHIGKAAEICLSTALKTSVETPSDVRELLVLCHYLSPEMFYGRKTSKLALALALFGEPPLR